MTEEAATTTTDGDAASDTAAGDSADKGFTQADVDRIVRDRLARQKAQFGDIDELKRKSQQFDELAESQKTEVQKALERAEAAEARAAELEAKTSEFEERERSVKLDARITAAAAAAGVSDVEAFVALFDRSGLEFDDDGKPTNIEDGITATLQKHPILAGRSTTTFDGGPRTPAPTPKGNGAMDAQIRSAAGRT